MSQLAEKWHRLSVWVRKKWPLLLFLYCNILCLPAVIIWVTLALRSWKVNKMCHMLKECVIWIMCFYSLFLLTFCQSKIFLSWKINTAAVLENAKVWETCLLFHWNPLLYCGDCDPFSSKQQNLSYLLNFYCTANWHAKTLKKYCLILFLLVAAAATWTAWSDLWKPLRFCRNP